MDRIGVAIVGTGGIAALWHLPELSRIPDFEIRVLAGRNPHRLARMQERYGGRIATDYAEAIHDPEVQAVVVATPHPLHVPHGTMTLEAGKHLLLQKPLAGNLMEAEAFARIARPAERAGRVILCLPYFSRNIEAIRDLVREQSIGVVSGAQARTSHGGPELYYARVREEFEEPEGDLWFFDEQRADVGALFDMGVYAISELIAILGNVGRVYGRATTRAKPTRLEDSASLLLEFTSGVVATAETGWCDTAFTWRLEIHGTLGRLATGLPSSPVVETRAIEAGNELPQLNAQEVDLARWPTRNAHEHWRDCIRSGTSPMLSTWRMARHVTEVMLAGLESSRRGQPVDVHSRLDEETDEGPDEEPAA